MVRMFNIDFNWDFLYRPASPGLYTHADPELHADFYAELGATHVMINTVSFNGYAWYPSDIVPRTPGPGENFAPRLADALKRRGIGAFGYFTLGYNPEWEQHNAEYRHLEVSAVTWKTPLLPRYLQYCASHVREVLQRVDLEGITVDWLHPIRRERWLDVEKQDYPDLMGETWPETDSLDEADQLEYDRRSIARAWSTLTAAIENRRRHKVFINPPFERPDDPLWTDHPALQETDWVLNEAPKPEMLDWLMRSTKPEAIILQNLCGWAEHDTEAVLQGMDRSRYGLFGFAQADPVSTLIATDGNWNAKANARNLAAVRKAFSR